MALLTVSRSAIARRRGACPAGSADAEINFLRAGLDTLRERLAYWRFRRGHDWLSSQPD